MDPSLPRQYFRRARGGMLIQVILGLLLLSGITAAAYTHFHNGSMRRQVMAWGATIAVAQTILRDVYSGIGENDHGWGPVGRTVTALRDNHIWATWEESRTQRYIGNDGMTIRIMRERSFIISLPSQQSCDALFNTAAWDLGHLRYDNDCRRRQWIWGYYKH